MVKPYLMLLCELCCSLILVSFNVMIFFKGNFVRRVFFGIGRIKWGVGGGVRDVGMVRWCFGYW